MPSPTSGTSARLQRNSSLLAVSRQLEARGQRGLGEIGGHGGQACGLGRRGAAALLGDGGLGRDNSEVCAELSGFRSVGASQRQGRAGQEPGLPERPSPREPGPIPNHRPGGVLAPSAAGRAATIRPQAKTRAQAPPTATCQGRGKRAAARRGRRGKLGGRELAARRRRAGIAGGGVEYRWPEEKASVALGYLAEELI